MTWRLDAADIRMVEAASPAGGRERVAGEPFRSRLHRFRRDAGGFEPVEPVLARLGGEPGFDHRRGRAAVRGMEEVEVLAIDPLDHHDLEGVEHVEGLDEKGATSVARKSISPSAHR